MTVVWENVWVSESPGSFTVISYKPNIIRPENAYVPTENKLQTCKVFVANRQNYFYNCFRNLIKTFAFLIIILNFRIKI